MNKKAVIWGDSVAKGVLYDSARNRYVLGKEPAAALIAKETGMEIINHSKMGSTSSDGIAIADKDIKNGISADFAIIEFGGNDCDFLWNEISEAPEKEHLPKTPEKEFESKMEILIDMAKDSGMTPMLVNLPPIDPNNYFDFISKKGLCGDNIIKWLGDVGRIYRVHEKYSFIITDIARKCSCKLFDVRSAFLSKKDSVTLLCADGIHPNAEGQRFLAETIISQL